MAFSSSRVLTLVKSSLRLPSSLSFTRFSSSPCAYRSPLCSFPDGSSSSAIANDTAKNGYCADSDEDIQDVSQANGDKPAQDFNFKMDKDAARIRLEIPGVDKQNLKLWFDKHALNFQATTEDKEFGVESFCEGTVEMPSGLLEVLKVEETKVDLKNGVLKVVIPKLKLEERDDVFIVSL